MSENRSLLRGLSDLHDIGAWIIAAFFLIIIGIGYVISAPFFEYVSDGEIVVEDCDGSLTVWRGGRENGLHWDGLCSTTTYDVYADYDLSLLVSVDGVEVQVRGDIRFPLPEDDVSIQALYKTHRTERAFVNTMIDSRMLEELHETAKDPSWHVPKGGIVKRNLKRALDYTLRRISPVGAFWASPEAIKSLEEKMQHRLDTRTFPYGVHPTIYIKRVIER